MLPQIAVVIPPTRGGIMPRRGVLPRGKTACASGGDHQSAWDCLPCPGRAVIGSPSCRTREHMMCHRAARTARHGHGSTITTAIFATRRRLLSLPPLLLRVAVAGPLRGCSTRRADRGGRDGRAPSITAFTGERPARWRGRDIRGPILGAFAAEGPAWWRGRDARSPILAAFAGGRPARWRGRDERDPVVLTRRAAGGRRPVLRPAARPIGRLASRA